MVRRTQDYVKIKPGSLGGRLLLASTSNAKVKTLLRYVFLLSLLLSLPVLVCWWSTGNVATHREFCTLFKVSAAVVMVTEMETLLIAGGPDDDGSIGTHKFNGPHQWCTQPTLIYN